MATYYVGPGGNDANDGLSWAQRFLTLNGAEDEPVAAGDVVLVGPGVYRETLTCDVSGGNAYSTGTVSVTKGSTTVEGSGTAWVANVAAGYMFHVRLYAYGTDGDTNADNTFSSAAGNFQANMVGMPIQIITLGAYTIATVVDTDNITLADPNGLGWPADDDTLTYSVMSGEGHYEVASVTDDDTLILKQPWQGRTLTGLAYLTFNPIYCIADVTGQDTDGVGGVVRITGSDNDQTNVRTRGIDVSSKDYRVFRGFRIDACDNGGYYLTSCDHIVVEDSCVMDCYSVGIRVIGSTCVTLRRMLCSGSATSQYVETAGNDSGIVLESMRLLTAQNFLLYIKNRGGITIRNVHFCGSYYQLLIGSALAVGQVVWVTNSFFDVGQVGIRAATLGEIIEDYNDVFMAVTARTNVAAGSHSQAYPPLLSSPLLHAGADQISGFKFPWSFGDLSQWSPLRAIAGVDERNTDMYGIRRPATAAKNSWGPVQFHDTVRETTTVRAGAASIKFADAGVHQIWVPVTNVETTISVYCYREADYAGTNPTMVIKQPGQADRTATDAAAASQWNLLTDTFTPAALPPYVIVELQSRNTDVANPATNDCFFDDLVVS